MEKDSNIKISEINVDGGMADNQKFIQNLSNILQIQVIKPNNIEASALGVAYLASLSSGTLKYSEAIAQLIKNKNNDKELNHFKPSMKKSLVEKRLLRWKRAVSTLLNYYD